jgi:branched-chain amino acid transport system permease protein
MIRPLSVIAAIVFVAVMGALPLLDSAYLITHATRILIYAIMAVSLDLLVGYCGLISLGHAAFFGVSAYTAAMLSTQAGISNVLIGLPLSLASAATGATIIGVLTLRTDGIYFIMATLAFAQMLFFLANDSDFFGGSDGLLLLGRFRALIGDVVLFDLSEPRTRYYAVLAAAFATCIGLGLMVRSPFGRVLQGIKSNQQRMRALGYPIERYKLACFVIGGTLSGLAGYLYLALTSLADPSILNWTQSAEVLMMVILGGLGTLIGPAAGAFVLIELVDQSSALTEHWKLIVGIVVILATLFARGGLAGLVGTLHARALETKLA